MSGERPSVRSAFDCLIYDFPGRLFVSFAPSLRSAARGLVNGDVGERTAVTVAVLQMEGELNKILHTDTGGILREICAIVDFI